LHGALIKLTSTRDELSRLMERASRDFANAERFIRGESAMFNSLGILQGTGPAIDRLGGLFDVQVDYAIDARVRVLKALAR